jgi:hypothetical protein
VTGDLFLKWLLDLRTEGIATVTAKDWEWDGAVADMIDTIIIANPNDSSDNEETSCEGAESEEATDFSDSKLARPL